MAQPGPAAAAAVVTAGSAAEIPAVGAAAAAATTTGAPKGAPKPPLLNINLLKQIQQKVVLKPPTTAAAAPITITDANVTAAAVSTNPAALLTTNATPVATIIILPVKEVELKIDNLKIERTKELERKRNKAKIDLNKNKESIKIIEEEIQKNRNENIQPTTITPITITPINITPINITPISMTKSDFDDSVNSLILSFLYMLKSMNIYNYNQKYIDNFKNAYTYINFPEGIITKYKELNETIKKIGSINLENLVSTTLKFENIKFFLGCVNSAALNAEDVIEKYKDALVNLNLINLSVQAFENIPVITLKSFEITNDYINGNENFRFQQSITANYKQKNCYYNLFLTPNQDLNNYNILYIYSKTNNNLNNLIQFKINFFEIKDSLNYQSNLFENKDFENLIEKFYKLQSVIYEKDNKYYCIYKYDNIWYDSIGNNVADFNETRNLVLFAYSTNEKEIEIKNELQNIPINEEPAQIPINEEPAQIPINKEPAKIPCNDNNIKTIVERIDIDNILNHIDYKKNNDENMVTKDFTNNFNNEIKSNATGFCMLEYNKNTNNFTVNTAEKTNAEKLLERYNIIHTGPAGPVEDDDEWGVDLDDDQIAEIKKNIKEKIKNMVRIYETAVNDNLKLYNDKLKILQENNKIIEENIKKVEEAIRSKTKDDLKKEEEAEATEAAEEKAAENAAKIAKEKEEEEEKKKRAARAAALAEANAAALAEKEAAALSAEAKTEEELNREAAEAAENKKIMLQRKNLLATIARVNYDSQNLQQSKTTNDDDEW
jgi:hypothetical protein